jgi:hypothetical protein
MKKVFNCRAEKEDILKLTTSEELICIRLVQDNEIIQLFHYLNKDDVLELIESLKKLIK